MQTKLSLRFWRVAFWGVITFLLFYVLYWYFLDVYIKFLIARKESFSSIFPNPFLPGIVSGVVVQLSTALALAALWWFQTWRKPVALRAGFARHKGNAELCIWLPVLILMMATSLSLPEHSHIATCRCCLFTVDEACGRGQLPSKGFYYFSTGSGIHAGIYASGDKGLTKYGFDKFAFENIEADRTRFGWPAQAITRDVVRRQLEWHIIFEGWAAVNLVFWFFAWLCIQPLISLAKWLLRFYKSHGMNGRVPQPSV